MPIDEIRKRHEAATPCCKLGGWPTLHDAKAVLADGDMRDHAWEDIRVLLERVAELEQALRVAAGELSTYRDTDKHPETQIDRLLSEARDDND